MYTDELGRITFASKDLIKEIYRGNLDKINLAEVVIDDDYLKYLEFVKDNALYEWPIPNPINNDNIDTPEDIIEKNRISNEEILQLRESNQYNDK